MHCRLGILLRDLHNTSLSSHHGFAVQSLSHIWLLTTPWTIAHQVSLSVGFFQREFWSGLPFSSPGDLPDPGIEPRSPALRADTLTWMTEDETVGWHQTEWTCVWASSSRWWRTGTTGMLLSMGSQRVGHETEQLNRSSFPYCCCC